MLTGEDIYYAAWVAGDSSAYTNEDNEEVEVYDAQLYLLQLAAPTLHMPSKTWMSGYPKSRRPIP